MISGVFFPVYFSPDLSEIWGKKTGTIKNAIRPFFMVPFFGFFPVFFWTKSKNIREFIFYGAEFPDFLRKEIRENFFPLFSLKIPGKIPKKFFFPKLFFCTFCNFLERRKKFQGRGGDKMLNAL